MTQMFSNLQADLHWIVQAFVVIFLSLLANLVQRRVLRRLDERVRMTPNLWDDAMIGALRRPLTMLIWVLGIAFAAQIARDATGAAILLAVPPIRDGSVVFALTWFLILAVRNGEEAYLAGKFGTGFARDPVTVQHLGRLLRISLGITGILVGVQTLGYSITGLLAFGGMGGVAVGFASRDLLANLFGSLMISLDRPFAIGDWIRSPDQDIVGVVEHIGWRLTTIRTFNKRPLYIPNATFTRISVENPSRMSHRRIWETVGIRYEDSARMADIVADVKVMLEEHQDIASDQTLMVNFNSFAPSSLDLFIYTFTKTTDWSTYHQVKQDILLKLSEIIDRHGAQIAFPTSTVHVPEGIPLQGKRPDQPDTPAASGAGSPRR